MKKNMDKLTVFFALTIHLCSSLNITPSLDLDPPSQNLDLSQNETDLPYPLGPPYLEDNRLCQDRMEMMETIEYDDEIHCQVKMKEVCEEKDESFEKACHTVYKKECEISYRPQMSHVKVKVCPGDHVERVDEQDSGLEEPSNSVVIDIRPTSAPPKTSSDCIDNLREICVTKFETECHTEMMKHQMAEDRPRCRVQLVESCSEGCEPSDPNCSDSTRSKCEKIPAMRCRIERQMVTKTKPVSKCERVPRKFCRKEKCGLKGKAFQQECYFRIQTVNEAVPETKCHLYPHRMCHEVKRRKRKNLRKSRNLSTEPMRCKFEPEEMCQTQKVNPRPVTKKMRRKMCKVPQTKLDFEIVRNILSGKEEENELGP